MSDVKTGSCLVCGEPATFKCSRCSREGGIDLFYCSKEHQTLLWPAHKLVCGSHAHPFRLPSFTQAEADSILQWVQTPPSSAWQCEVHARFYESCWRVGAVNTAAFPALTVPLACFIQEHLNRLVGHGGPLHPAKGSFDEQVLLMRKHNFDYHTTPSPNSPLGGSTLGYFSSTYLGMTARQIPPTDAQWFSEFCHHREANRKRLIRWQTRLVWSAASPPLCAAPAAAKAARTGLGDPSTSYFARRSINASYALFSHPWRKHTSDDHFSAPTQIWPMHRAFCGERAFPVHFPVFRQEDVDRVIAILSDEPVLERLAAAHLKFKEDLQLFYSGMGTSVEEIKDNLNSFANRYDLLVTLPSRHDEPTSQDTHLAMRYFQTLKFLTDSLNGPHAALAAELSSVFRNMFAG
ncbi:hypothetical protein C6P46_006637 [Rhodotorula mucilaginosa]|uniref:MYND-type domain-containing protein n=1 Tax=Rhodotorula mucilaginosa TaxID=5537 RepID=A0A9P6VY24_RHOMI|nr:hypothetical protein C6P46_006637 [Rhodotorula mucilaginosa]